MVISESDLQPLRILPTGFQEPKMVRGDITLQMERSLEVALQGFHMDPLSAQEM
jgi:hypothetical protein